MFGPLSDMGSNIWHFGNFNSQYSASSLIASEVLLEKIKIAEEVAHVILLDLLCVWSIYFKLDLVRG